MSSIGPRDAASTTALHGLDGQPTASSSGDSASTTEAPAADRSRGGGGGRMAVLASLSATAPVAAGPVGDLVQEYTFTGYQSANDQQVSGDALVAISPGLARRAGEVP
jgi:hypothetical protein